MNVLKPKPAGSASRPAGPASGALTVKRLALVTRPHYSFLEPHFRDFYKLLSEMVTAYLGYLFS
jgi:hypothetical protein